LVSTAEGPPGSDVRAAAAVERVWAVLSDAERQAFHRFCCDDARDLQTVEVVAKISALVEQAMQTN
jgi:hypothetical protein